MGASTSKNGAKVLFGVFRIKARKAGVVLGVKRAVGEGHAGCQARGMLGVQRGSCWVSSVPWERVIGEGRSGWENGGRKHCFQSCHLNE
eukprot:356126-Chlamydomonas_euryale.AAC.2